MTSNKIDDGFDESWLTLVDHNGAERENVHPFLMFDAKDGKLIIADDYECGNDPTARDFGLSKEGAVKLARALQRYAKNGAPSDKESVSQWDVENALASA
jgi:hypothetical protein